MSSYNSDRRSVLKIIGAIGATCAYPFAGDELFAAAPEHAHAPAAATSRFFKDSDFRVISRLADLVIPETDTPGAVAAGVPDYIDLLVARNQEHQFLIADGLRWLDSEGERVAGKPFLELTEEQQIAILEPLDFALASGDDSARNVQFFKVIKSLTADGYYTSKVGLLEELGYSGNTARTSFPDCIHEH